MYREYGAGLVDIMVCRCAPRPEKPYAIGVSFQAGEHKSEEAIIMNGLAHDMYLAEMARLPDHCKYPEMCLMREDGPCAWSGIERTCPLVKAAERRKKAAAAATGSGNHSERDLLICRKHGEKANIRATRRLRSCSTSRETAMRNGFHSD